MSFSYCRLKFMFAQPRLFVLPTRERIYNDTNKLILTTRLCLNWQHQKAVVALTFLHHGACNFVLVMFDSKPTPIAWVFKFNSLKASLMDVHVLGNCYLIRKRATISSAKTSSIQPEVRGYLVLLTTSKCNFLISL